MRLARFLLVVLLGMSSAWAEPQLKAIKIAVSNPTAEDRPAADITLSIADLRKAAPDFYAGSQIVTAGDASTLDQDAALAKDAAALRATELPSQIDDLDGDHKPDELAFQVDLKPHQTRIVTITYGPPDRIFRMRGDYAPRTNAIFATKIEGMGWESERIAFRLYFDKRNAVDIYGKTRPMLLLDRFATPGYVYHNASPDGRDIYLVGDAIGAGAVAGWVNGATAKVADVANRQWRIISTGPVRAIFELSYNGWSIAGKTLSVKSRIAMWAGERGFTQTVTSGDAGDFLFATGLTRQQNIPDLRSRPDDAESWVAMWGQQVVQPANRASAPILKGSNLGLAVIMAPGVEASVNQDSKDYLLTFPLKDQTASWYTMAAWDQEASNNPVGVGTGAEASATGVSSAEVRPKEARFYVNFIASGEAIKTEDQFLAAVRRQASRMQHPATAKVLSSAAQVQAAPPDTLHAAGSSESWAAALEKREH
jgi:hypothetical protein